MPSRTLRQGPVRAGQRPESRRGRACHERVAGLPRHHVRQPRSAPRIGDEVVNILASRGKAEPAEPGDQAPPLLVGPGPASLGTDPTPRPPPWSRWPTLRVRPQSPDLVGGRSSGWLAHRQGNGMAAPQGQGAGAGGAGSSIYGAAEGGRGPILAGGLGQRSRGVQGRCRSARRRGQGDPRASRRFVKPSDKNARPLPHRGARPIRLRRDAHRLHTRLRPRSGHLRQGVRHPSPRVLARQPHRGRPDDLSRGSARP